MTLKLQSKLNQESATLYCEGDLVGGSETTHLRHAVTQLFRERESVVLDLSGIGYMTSGGLSTLVGLYSTARTSGGTLKYVNLSVEIDFSRRQVSTQKAA